MISYHFENTDPIQLDANIICWLEKIIILENNKLGEVQYIFCNDEYLLEINKKHLDHDFLTDIITFDYVRGRKISGDIFVSLERIIDNCSYHKTEFQQELLRVLAHGILHLCGYKDKTDDEQSTMTFKENYYLNLYN